MLDPFYVASRRVIAARVAVTGRGVARPTEPITQQAGMMAVKSCLASFEDAVRYLRARRAAPSLIIDSEDKVQDALYLLLRPSIPDLAWENPNLKEAARSWRPDFTSVANAIALDAKYVRDTRHGRSIITELDEDIAAARELPDWKHLFFFIYDPGLYLPCPTAITDHCDGTHYHEGRSVYVHTVISPSSHTL